MSKLSRMLVRLAALGAAGTLALGVAAAPAAAHNALTKTLPAKNAKVDEAPDNVRLTFLSPVDPATSTFTLTDAAGADVTGGTKPRFAKSTVYLKLNPTAAGKYTAGYEITSDDGHPIKGKVSFTLTEAAVAAARPSPSPTPSPTLAADAGGDSLAEASPAASTQVGGGFNWWWVAAGAGLLILLGLVETGRRARKEA